MRRQTRFFLALIAVLALAFSSSTIGQQAPAGRQGGPPPVQLAEGAGREQVQATCARCHGLNMITNSWGYTKDGWQDRIATMVKLGSPELDTISSYLAAHYPIKDAPSAVLLSGPATVTIKEWMAPTLGSRPHDSHAAADGSIWWTGQFASKLGRLDPRTGQIREFDLPPNTQPHGLAEDTQGNIWYTGIQKGVIGMLNPRTGKVDEYPIKEPGARGPHTPILNKKTGDLFFTLQSGHVGRINTCQRRHRDQEDAERQHLSRTASASTRRVCRGTWTSAATGSAASIRRRWRSRNIRFRAPTLVRAA